jgi:TolB-like protein/tetratricopeptide (TPR) repeat protein
VKKASFYILFVFLLLPEMIFLGCAQQPSKHAYLKNGKAYGVVKGTFRHRWWNYYERGLSYAEGQFYEEAVLDLRSAIKQRDKDQRSARTYGMHFVDYFPHRELGVVFFHTGRYEEAEAELENSLSTADTGKAKHFLNMVRKVMLEESKKDAAPPMITLAAESKGRVINSLKVELKGEVEDDFYARKIAINDEPQFIELSAKKIPFSKKIKLQKGLNEIKIKTTDLIGNVTEEKVNIIADFEGPALNIKNFSDGQKVENIKVVLNGALLDATGVTMLKINDQEFTYNKEREIEFAFEVDLIEGNNNIQLAASDIAGNTTKGELNLTYVPEFARRKSPFKNSLVKTNDRKEPILIAFSGKVVTDDGHGFFYKTAKSRKSASAFRLKFKDLTDTQTVYYDTMFIDGSATGTNEVESVSINDSPLLIIPGRTVYFSQLIDLQEGENKITIEVVDTKGNTASKTVTVVHRVPKVHKVLSRMSLAIMPFVIKGEASTFSSIVYDNLMDAFINQNRFNIVSRGDELEVVLREQKLSQTDLVDKSTAVRIGKLVAAEGILMGTVHETKDSIEIFARLVNTETSTVLEAKDVFGQDKSVSHLRYLTNGLALKLKHSFPLIEGLVIKTKGKDIYADFGSFERIKKEMKFIVFRQGETIVHPVTGKILGNETEEIGVATIVTVFEDMSIGKLVVGFDPKKVHLNDLVITK